MTITYCICTNSHLAYAKILGDSIRQHNPDYLFLIGLVDQILPESVEHISYPIIQVEDLNIPEWDLMNSSYNPFELCCALKPFFAYFILKNYQDVDSILYFDTDIIILNSLEPTVALLNEYNIIITPHLLLGETIKHQYDHEVYSMKAGYFNGGFFGVKNSEVSSTFLVWWENRLKTHGYDKMGVHTFVDQGWLNLVPYVFDKVLIDRSGMLNVAYWNFEFRNLNYFDGKYLIKNQQPLVFFHLSDYKRLADGTYTCHNGLKNNLVTNKIYQDYNLCVTLEDSLLNNGAKSFYGKSGSLKTNKVYAYFRRVIIRYSMFILKKL